MWPLAPFSNMNHSPRGSAEIGSTTSNKRQRSLKCDCEAERSFNIALSPEDVSHLTTVRAVLQCVRLRRWERELVAQDQPMTPAIEREAAAPSPSMRERFVRYTPPTPPVHMPAESPSFAIRKS